MFENKLYLRAALLGDGYSLVHDPFVGLWHCLWIPALFVIQKLRFKYVFDQELSSMSDFIALWKDEVCQQLLAKGALLIKDAKRLVLALYFDFVSALVSLKKRL